MPLGARLFQDRTILLFAAAAGLCPAAPPAGPRPEHYRLVPGVPRSGQSDPLGVPVGSFRASALPIESAFLSVSRTYGITFVLEPGLKGEVTLEVRGGTVRDLIEALARTQGCCWQLEGRLVVIRRNLVRFYEIDYPQMTRSAQGSSSVVLSAQATGPAGLAAGPPVAPGYPGMPGAAGGSSDQTNLSIQQQNQTTFWSDLLAELTALAQPGETAAVNKLAGVAIVSAPPARQDEFKAFVALVNRRISQQVRISARVLEVNLDSQHQLGVDWALIGARAGTLALGPVATRTAFQTLVGEALVPSTVTGTVGAGKLSAVVKALEQEGEVRAVSNPSVVSLSNQTAFVKVGTEQTFFSLANATTINSAAATAQPYATTQSNYSQNAITIGTVLYVTPEVNTDGTVTVDVLPAVTQLIGVDSSPDGQQTAPRMDIKALSTIARLRSGETVMIGGLIQDRTRRQADGVPGVSAIPLLGKLFATTARSASRSELVIFLSAEVIR